MDVPGNNRPAYHSVKSIFKKSAFAFFVKAAGLVAGFIFTYMISRYYGEETLGMLTICMNLVQVLALFTVMGFDNALMKLSAGFSAAGNFGSIRFTHAKICMVALPFSLCLTFACYAASGFMADVIFGKPALLTWFRISSLMIVPSTFLLIHASGLRGIHQTSWFSFFRETSRFLFAIPLLGLLLYLFGGNQFVPLLSYSMALFSAAVLSYLIWNFLLPSTGIETDSNEPGIKDLFVLALPFFLVTALSQLSPLLTSLLLGVKGTAGDVGIFNVAAKIAGLLSLPLLAVNMVSAPVFADLHDKNDRKIIQQTATQTTRLIFWTSLPLLVCCLAAPSWMMEQFGSSFGAGSTALIYIAIAQFVNAASGSVGVILQMTGHQRIWATILFFTTLLNVILIYWLVPLYGINGAAISLMTVMIINNIAGAAYLRLKLGIRTFYFPILAP